MAVHNIWAARREKAEARQIRPALIRARGSLQPVRAAQSYVGEALPTDVEAAAAACAVRPGFEVQVGRAPAAQVEVANAEAGALGPL